MQINPILVLIVGPLAPELDSSAMPAPYARGVTSSFRRSAVRVTDNDSDVNAPIRDASLQRRESAKGFDDVVRWGRAWPSQMSPDKLRLTKQT